jgi:hypothetical protein
MLFAGPFQAHFAYGFEEAVKRLKSVLLSRNIAIANRP